MPRGRLPLPCAVALLAAIGIAGPGCDGESDPPLSVWAASSLTDALPKVAQAYEQTTGDGPIRLSFDATSRLAHQIEAGAPADLFLSADRRWMDHLEQKELIQPGTRTPLLGNRLVVVVPREANRTPSRLEQLADTAYGRIALAGPGVPAGRYAESALRSRGLWNAMQGRAVRGDNVRATLAWVARGEVDAGFVYASDARGEPEVRIALRVPDDLHPAIVYPAAVTAHASGPQRARAFLSFCQGDQAMRIFRKAGFRAHGGS
jgi:molybdate transport system substrate-binding protein